MNKAELIEKIAKDAGITFEQARKALDSFCANITNSLKEGKPAKVTGFGTFKTKKFNERLGTNPQTGATILIPEKTVVRFVPGAMLKKDGALEADIYVRAGADAR